MRSACDAAPRWRRWSAALGVGLWLLLAAPAVGQGPPPAVGTRAPAPSTAAAPASGPSLSLNLSGGTAGPASLGTALEIVLFMTLLSLAPAIVMTMTCFTRIVIVLSFLKRAMSMQELPPPLVVTGFAVFMSVFIMRPVAGDVYEQAYRPYVAGEIGFEEAAEAAGGRMKQFMLRQTRPDDIALILRLAGGNRPRTPDDLSFDVVVPSFILSEVKTAFQMGFVLFLPFVVIDLVIAAILVSMGMFTLPPVVISTPLKLLLFVMVDGWNLVVGSLAESFTQT
jgi:flagellar biosynthetic protein FliP